MSEQGQTDTNRQPGPLDGLLIADFSRVLAGPYCTMLLGDLGAASA
jgi:crotonobetainyl-CoA:carnitine CoA-transferase CaiB-like acyl-CoA transferase